ncbi:hypothetical protein [Methylobacterium sp. sgz302541]|uniref:hypothetical protein n=1 Tax=unclassified Methylobacterium TaxID=2615210 RepID=UPI003D351739
MQKSHNSLKIVVVTTQEQLMHALFIRSICFMEEEHLKISHAFDGNDFQATHMVAYDCDEPIGATRIRWFKDFAKIERTAFRPAFRNARTLKTLSEFVFAHVARKGYSRLITHAGPRYVPLWRRVLGFEVVEGKPPLVSPDYEDCVELVKELVVPHNAISQHSDVGTLYRVEGAWDTPTWLG